MSNVDLPARRANLSEAKLALLEKLRRGKTTRSEDAPAIPRRNEHDQAPLSCAQQQLWFLDQLVPDHPFYVIPAAVRLNGALNVTALEQSLNDVVKRHESLRTTFAAPDGQPAQIIHSSLSLSIPVTVLPDVNGCEKSEVAMKLAKQEARRSFDLTQLPLFRVSLVRITDNEHLLLLMMHHIISDEWSIGVLLREIAVIYEGYVTGTTPLLPELEIQCADFGAWQQEWLKGEAYQKQLSYWMSRLDGVPSLLELPADHQRPAVPSFRGNRQQVWITEDMTESLKRLGARNGATPFMVVMAAFNVLLHRYTGQGDIALGFPVANRDRSEVAGLIGCFINTLVMRSDLSGDPSFQELLIHVKKVALDAYAHKDTPFEKIVDEIQPERDLSRNPLCNVMFVFQNAIMPALELPGVRLTPIQIHNDTAKLDLALSMAEENNGLTGYFEYSIDLFEDATIARMIGHLGNLVKSIEANPDQPISSLAMLEESERRQLTGWAAGELETRPDRRIHHLIESRVEQAPDAIAVSSGGRQITYDELNRRSNLLANHLTEMGVGPETIVGICMKSSPEIIVAMLAVLKSGGAYLPLDPDYPDQRLAMMIDDSLMPVLITMEEFEGRLPAYPGQIFVLDAEWDRIASRDYTNPAAAVLADNLAYVIYTSGSSGRPKGVPVTHRGLLNLILWHLTEFSVTSQDRATQLASVGFDACVWEIWPYLAAGASIHIAEENMRTSPTDLQSLIISDRITICFMATPLAEAALILEWPDESSLRFLLTGGDKLHQYPSTALPFKLVNNYGPTENTVVSTSMLVKEKQGRVNEAPSIGNPISNTKSYVLSRGLELTPQLVSGELCIGGESLARGYLFDARLTAQKFIPDPFESRQGGRLYKSGDLGRFRADGALEFVGRIDRQVKIRGNRIELGEVETALLSHKTVRDAVVTARSEKTDKKLIAYVVTKDGRPPAVSEIRNYLKTKLPEHMLPAVFVTLEALPLTANGKVDRRALPPPESKRSDLSQTFAAPRNRKEKQLADIWKQVLGLEQVGVHDNFFELGGDSILSIQVVTRANQAGMRLASRQIFQHQTIAELAGAADTVRAIEAEQQTVEGPVPLTPIQKWFFERDFADLHQYNQAVMLAARQRLDPTIVERAVEHLIRHHDALRLRFKREGSGWIQVNEAVEENSVFSRIDLSIVAEDRRDCAIRAAAVNAQESLDLSAGPLARVVLFDFERDKPPLLLMVIHHLAVDAVSWRILLEDLETAYRQLGSRETAELPLKTTSFKGWAERLAHYAASEAAADETGYWLNGQPAHATPLPVDFAGGSNTVGFESSVVVSLEEEQTQALIQDVPPVYHTQINDVLLTALAVAYSRWSGFNRLVVDLEGHGREEISEDLDVSRTVGWFTTIYPVSLDTENTSSPADALKRIKEHLRSIPRRGAGYGMLRYLTSNEETAARLRALDCAQVSFNYLGRLDQAVSESSLFTLSPLPVGPVRSSRAARGYLLEINGWILGGKLQFEWIYSNNVHRRETVEKFAGAFIEVLTDLISHCQSDGAGGYTPSDFPLAGVDQVTLDRITGLNQKVQDIYPLSPTQQGMLFHSLYEPDSGVYVSQISCELKGDLDFKSFEAAWRQLVGRHDVLRTKVVLDDLPAPLQVVLSDVGFEVDCQDWRNLDETEQDAGIRDLLEHDRRKGFDFSVAPLMRVGLIRLENNRYQFFWSHHHMLLDGWSTATLLKELFNLYESKHRGEEPKLEGARLYRDYIEWVRRQDKSKAEKYWKEFLKGYTTPTLLGVERSSQEGSSDPAYGEVRLCIEGDAAEHLAQYARRRQLTLNNLVQGAWAVLLSRYSGERDVVFGATVSGRAMALDGVDKMIGLFINTLPVRAEIDEQSVIVDWLRRLQQQLADRQECEYSSLGDVHRWSDLEPGVPLFESILVFENYPVDESLMRRFESAGRIEISKVKSVEPTNYGLTVVAVPGSEFKLEIGYDKKQYDEQTVSRMLGHLRVLLEGIVSDTAQRVSDLPMLDYSEQQQVLFEWRTTPADFPLHLCIHDLFEAQVRRSPDALAVVADSGYLTYRELDRQANRLANYLRALGVTNEITIGVCFDRGISLIIALLAASKSGGAYVPLDPAYPAERLRFMLEDAGASVLLTEQTLSDLFDGLSIHTVRLDTDWPKILNHGDSIAPAELTPASAVYIVFTSGSTGKPKGVVIPHRALVNECCAFARHHGLKPRERLLQFASVAFDVTAEEVFAPLISGATVVVAPSDAVLSISEFLSLCERDELTVLNLPSAYWHEWVGELARGKERLPSSLRLVIVGNEKALLEKLDRWRQAVRDKIEWKNAYGPTEATITTTIYRAAHESTLPLRSVPIGRPIWNSEVFLLDREMRPVPIQVAGELHIGGAGLARGYLNQPEMTAERFPPNPYARDVGERLYNTGDLARYLEDGNIEFIGRLDDQVKIRGFRIELGEVESALTAHPAVREAVALVREASSGDRKLVGYVVFADRKEADEAAVREFLKERLPEFMIPATLVALDALPKTPTGKIDRRSLPSPEKIRSESHGLPPRTEIEMVLAGIWREVLGVQRVGLDDNFFSLGGDSILSLQIVSRAGQAGIKLTPKQIFEHPTVCELARTAESVSPVDADQTTVSGKVLLTPIQQWFFQQDIAEPARYSHAVLLRVGPNVEADLLSRVVERMIDHHDALRMRYRQVGGEWEQENAEREGADIFSALDLSITAEQDRQSALDRAVRDVQAQLDLTSGPLIRVALLDLGADNKRLLIVVHHLVVDAVSWRVLLEDLQTAYEQLSRGGEIELPAKTTSFKKWAERLSEYAQSEDLRQEGAYWLEALSGAAAIRTRAAVSGVAPSLMRSVKAEMGEEETQALVKESPEVYRTHIDEMLLAALSEAYSEWSGERSVVVDLEGHGREEIIEGIDLSRTVGWFTTIFPVRLDKIEAEGIGDRLKRIKEQLRRVPRKGIGYGLLRYLTDDGELRRRIAELPHAELSFNYLGQADQLLPAKNDFCPAPEPLADEGSLAWSSDYLIELNVMIRGGKLLMDWTYNEKRFTKNAIEDLAQRYLSELRRLIDHCRSPEAGGFTPADFPEIDLSQKELDEFISEVTELID